MHSRFRFKNALKRPVKKWRIPLQNVFSVSFFKLFLMLERVVGDERVELVLGVGEPLFDDGHRLSEDVHLVRDHLQLLQYPRLFHPPLPPFFLNQRLTLSWLHCTAVYHFRFHWPRLHKRSTLATQVHVLNWFEHLPFLDETFQTKLYRKN